jgi:hypothetical protein
MASPKAAAANRQASVAATCLNQQAQAARKPQASQEIRSPLRQPRSTACAASTSGSSIQFSVLAAKPSTLGSELASANTSSAKPAASPPASRRTSA